SLYPAWIVPSFRVGWSSSGKKTIRNGESRWEMSIEISSKRWPWRLVWIAATTNSKRRGFDNG
ncbi:MAG: hypothetical protein VYB08_03525, partial [Candidatus Latescibacterota bacterium]|nr:hypothetical protein [Candidatus Latescibacterota bacterium]